MNKNSIFVLGLIGSILGILTSILWLFIGTFFISGVIVGVMEEVTQENVPFTFSSVAPGLVIAFFQSGITIAAFVIALVKTTPSSLSKGIKASGIWTLVSGIVSLVINPFHFISSVLLIIAGSLAIKGAKKENVSNDSFGNESAATSVDESINTENDSEPEQPNTGVVYVVLGWVFFGISLLIVPLLFGAGAFIMGFLTYKSRSQTHGVVMMTLAVAAAIVGTLLSWAVNG